MANPTTLNVQTLQSHNPAADLVSVGCSVTSAATPVTVTVQYLKLVDQRVTVTFVVGVADMDAKQLLTAAVFCK